jgi:hypothetical protein
MCVPFWDGSNSLKTQAKVHALEIGAPSCRTGGGSRGQVVTGWIRLFVAPPRFRRQGLSLLIGEEQLDN